MKSTSERFSQEERALLADLLQRGTEAGELDVADPDLTARVILRAYKSFTPPWIFMEARDEVERLFSAMHAVVLRGVIARR